LTDFVSVQDVFVVLVTCLISVIAGSITVIILVFKFKNEICNKISNLEIAFNGKVLDLDASIRIHLAIAKELEKTYEGRFADLIKTIEGLKIGIKR